MILRAQEFNSLMTTGMKLSLSRVVQDWMHNSLCLRWLGTLVILLTFFLNCSPWMAAPSWCCAGFHHPVQHLEGEATSQDTLDGAPAEVAEYPRVQVELPHLLCLFPREEDSLTTAKARPMVTWRRDKCLWWDKAGYSFYTGYLNFCDLKYKYIIIIL